MKFITYGIFLILALILTSSADAADNAMTMQKTIIWQGIVAVPTTFTVAKGETLEIRPGSRIVFSEESGLMVHGVLKAVGQKGMEIVFSSAKKGDRGSWNEIMFEGADESRMEHCVIEYATWGVHCHDTKLKVIACTFRDSAGGLRFRGGPLTIRQSTFTGNGIGLRSYQGEAQITECDFSANGTGIFVREKGSGLGITRSNFSRNSTYNIRLGDFNEENVQAQDNWWGEGAPETTIFDDRIEPGIGRVHFEPYSRARFL